MYTDHTGQDLGGAVSVERGRCFRWVYDEFGKGTNCWRPVTGSGWLYLSYRRAWHYVDCCARHAEQLSEKPGPR